MLFASGGARNRTEAGGLKVRCSTFELRPRSERTGSTCVTRHPPSVANICSQCRVCLPQFPWVAASGRPPAPTRRCPVELRECPRHGLVEFAAYSHRGGRPRWRCKRCVGEAVTRRLQKIKRLLVKEAGGRCVVCGYDRCIVSLHFRHVDPASKAFSMSMASGKSRAAYRERHGSASSSAPTATVRSKLGSWSCLRAKLVGLAPID